MCMTNEAAAIKLAERDNLVGELVEMMWACVGSLEYVNAHYPVTGGRFTRECVIKRAKELLAKAHEGAQS